MSYLRVKICGITRLEDALCAEDAGADAVGLNFVPGTKRAISHAQASAISSGLGPLIARVGIFRDAPLEEILVALHAVKLTAIQLHGSESDDFAATVALHVPVIRAISHGSALPAMDTLLIDNLEGGSGQTFDWNALETSVLRGRRWLLAGGLTPDNVGSAVQQLRPWGVDVSSGVESAPGIKDHTKITAFVKAARDGAVRDGAVRDGATLGLQV